MNTPTRPAMPPTRWLRRFIWIVGLALLIQGSLSVLVRTLSITLPELVYAFVNADPLHASIHIIWGLIMLGVMLTGPDERRVIWLALTFGLFYTSLAFFGVLVHHPWGLKLDLGENVFHFSVGPAAFLLGLWASRARALRHQTQPHPN